MIERREVWWMETEGGMGLSKGKGTGTTKRIAAIAETPKPPSRHFECH